MFPTAKKHYNPTMAACNVYKLPSWPKRLPFKCKDAKMEEFLRAGQLSDRNKFQVDLSVLDLGVVSLSPYDNYASQDKILRNGLIDNFITDSLIEAGNVRLQALWDNWDYVLDMIKKGNLDFKCELRHLMELGSLAFASNLLNRNDLIAGFTNNKMYLRERLLFKTKGNSLTKDKLRLSNLASPSVFGDLPESFTKTLNAAAGNPYSSLVLKSRPFKSDLSPEVSGSGSWKKPRSDPKFNINFAESSSAPPKSTPVSFRGVSSSQATRGRGSFGRGSRGSSFSHK